MLSMFRIGDWIINLSKDSRPEEIMIEVTTRCNFSCIHCFRNMMSEDFTDMDIELFKKIINEASQIGVKWIVFSGWGEPLVHPRIIEFLKYTKERGLRILLNTNGFLLKKYVEEIYDIKVDKIVISIDSLREDIYKKIRIGGELSSITESLTKIKDFKIRDSSRSPEINIQFTLNRLNVDDLGNLAEFAYMYGVSRVVLSNLIPLNKWQEDNLACYTWADCKERIRDAKPVFIKYGLEHGIEFSIPNFNVSYSERTCPFMQRKALFVRHDGKVAPCIYYAHNWRNTLIDVDRQIKEIIFGDLKRESILDIWRKNDYIGFRGTVYFMIYPSCLDCVLLQYCTLTLSNEMDCWGNNPSCSHCPYSRDLVRCPL